MTSEEQKRLSEIEASMKEAWPANSYSPDWESQPEFTLIKRQLPWLLPLARKQAEEIASQKHCYTLLAEHAEAEHQKLAAAEAENVKLRAENERMRTGRYERGDLWNAYTDLRRKLEASQVALRDSDDRNAQLLAKLREQERVFAQLREGKADSDA